MYVVKIHPFLIDYPKNYLEWKQVRKTRQSDCRNKRRPAGTYDLIGDTFPFL